MLTTSAVSCAAGLSLVGEVEGTSEMGGVVEMPGAVEDVDTETEMLTSAIPTTSTQTQQILGKFVDEWLQVLGKKEMKSVAIFLCYHLVSMLSY